MAFGAARTVAEHNARALQAVFSFMVDDDPLATIKRADNVHSDD